MSANGPKKTVSREAVLERLQGLSLPANVGGPTFSDRDWACFEVAAVLAYFRPDQFRLPSALEPEPFGTFSCVVKECRPIRDESGAECLTLGKELRRRALQRLGSRSAIENLLVSIAPRPENTLQQVFESYVCGTAKSLDAQSGEELRCTLDVIDWLWGLDIPLPRPGEVTKRIEIQSLLEPLRQLVGSSFVGRARELDLLREYVQALPPESAYDVFRRAVKWNSAEAPLLIYGEGGVGKSTLVAKFLLDHAVSQLDPFPFAYLDFDRVDLSPENPISLLAEIVRQISLEFPRSFILGNSLVRRWKDKLASSADPSDTRALEGDDIGAEVGAALDIRPFVQELAHFLWRDYFITRPFLLVIDTFEEIQYRGIDVTEEFFQFLEELQRHLPRLKVVLSGRTSTRDLRLELRRWKELAEIRLDVLDATHALELLRLHGITDVTQAQSVLKQVGTNPLSLTLALCVLDADTGTPDMDGIVDAANRAVAISDSVVQGRLYRRILGHVHCEEVRRIAQFAVVLRRIDAPVMQQVLAEPVGITVDEQSFWETLFEEFRREIALVTDNGDGSVHFRSDLRRTMLALLTNDDNSAGIMKQIHGGAVRFYEAQEGVLARAEEIYHRLCLGQSSDKIAARWLPGIEDHLRGVLDELPMDAQPILASRIGAEIDPRAWQRASQVDWERYAIRRSRILLNLGKPEKLLALLHKRQDRTAGSMLYAAEARALAALGRWSEALAVAERGIASALDSTLSAALPELVLLTAEAQAALGHRDEALETLVRVENLHERTNNLPRLLEVELTRARIFRHEGDSQRCESADRAMFHLSSMSGAQAMSHTSLLRRILAELGDCRADLWKTIARLCGLGLSLSPERTTIVEIFKRWDEQASRATGAAAGVLAGEAGIQSGTQGIDSWKHFVETARLNELDTVADALIERKAIPECLLIEFTGLMRRMYRMDS